MVGNWVFGQQTSKKTLAHWQHAMYQTGSADNIVRDLTLDKKRK
jgi:hypothetical protein